VDIVYAIMHLEKSVLNRKGSLNWRPLNCLIRGFWNIIPYETVGVIIQMIQLSSLKLKA